MSKVDIIEDEIDFLPSEAGTKDEKNTISDSIFNMVNNPTSIALRLRDENVDMTINIEMQKETRESVLGYNIISRAIYYGASVLRDTVKAGDTKYSGIHKVYTIWLCAKNLNLEMYDDKKYSCIHKYG